MTITLSRLDPAGADREALVALLVSNDWPFHVRPTVAAEQVSAAIDAGAYRDDDNDTFWVEHDQLGRIGVLRLEDLTDQAPLFDLRLDASARGRGLGAEILRVATDHVFSTMPQVRRFEGQTREDNIAMRKTFQRAGWVKEAHYREGGRWPGVSRSPRWPTRSCGETGRRGRPHRCRGTTCPDVRGSGGGLSPAASAPLLQVASLGSQSRRVPVTGVDDGLVRQGLEQTSGDVVEQAGEVLG